MSMSIEMRLLGALLAVLAGLVALAIVSPNAKATVIEPAEADVDVALQDGEISWFIPNNAYGPVGVGCTAVDASFTIPNEDGPPPAGIDPNENNPSVGTYSDDSGGVLVHLDSAPQFSSCAAYINPNTPSATAIAGVGVESVGDWSLSGDAVIPSTTGSPDGIVAITAPESAVTIDLGQLAAGCLVGVPLDRAISVMSDFYNGTDETTDPSTLEVDSQVDFLPNANCAALSLGSPSQFEANLVVTTPGDVVTITP